MKAPTQAVAVLTLAVAALAANAQGVYRCGNDYGQTRCPSGKEIQVDDSRTAEQKKLAQDVAAENRKTADAMEKARLAQEARASRAVIVPVTTKPVEKPVKAVKKKSKKKADTVESETSPTTSSTYTKPAVKTKKDRKPASKRKTGGE